MKHANEKRVERYLRVQMQLRGYKAIKLESHVETGLPDRLLLFPDGRACFVELKSEGEEPTERQSYVHAKLRGLGFQVFVTDNKTEIDRIIKAYSPKK